jgi:hypothetical protein
MLRPQAELGDEDDFEDRTMNPLLKRLAVLRVKVRLLDGWQGVCALVAAIVGIGFAVGVLDYWAHLPNLIRAVALVGLLIGSGAIAYRYLVRPVTRSCDDLSLALRVEDEFPELTDALASTVQFLKQSAADEVRVGLSPAMRERTVQETIAQAAKCDFGRILDRRGGLLFGAAALAILLTAGFVANANRAYAGIAFWRLVEPFGPHTWTTVAVSRQAPLEMLEEEHWEALDSAKKDRIAIGRPYRIKVDIAGQIPKHAKVEIEGQMIRSDKLIELKAGADKTASFEHYVDMTQQRQKFKFRVLANDGSFPPRTGSWHEVEVVPPPKLVDLDGQPSPQTALYPPLYTDLPRPLKLLPGTRDLEVMAGTNVVLRAKADRPLAQAWIEFQPDNALAAPASVLSFFGQTGPLQAVAQAAIGNAVWGRIPAHLDKEGSVLTVSFMPWVSGHYVLHVRDRDRLEWHGASELRVQLDPVPIVKLVQPASSVTAHPKADIHFKFRVTDEIFAVRSVFVEYRKKQPDGVWIGAAKRAVLFDASDFGKKLPALLAQANRLPLPGRDLRLRYKEMDFEVVWPLRNEGFVDGDLVVVDVCADDFCDIYPTREPGRSHQVELRIISPKQITQEAARDLADIQKTLTNLQEMQQKALDTTKDARKADKIDPKTVDKFIDDDVQAQRRIQDLVGRAPDEGLRRDLARIRKNLKDNQLTDTPAYRDASKIKGALDSMAKQELPQIEPKLNDIRNDLTLTEKNSPALKKKLDDVAPLQQRVLSGLKELNKELDPSARMEQQRTKLRDMIEQQKELRAELEKLKLEKESLDSALEGKTEELKQVKKNFEERMEPKIKKQRELARDMRELVQELKATKQNLDTIEDQDNAKKIGEALKITGDAQDEPKAKSKQPEKKKQPDADKPPPISKRMNDAAKELQDKKDSAPQETLDAQKDLTKQMERALEALEGRPADVTKQEIEKRKEAEKKITDLQKELKQLQDETKKTEQIQDKEERLKKKEELAAKTAALQEKMQEVRRQLARLEEKRAEENINEADKNLDQARKDLQNGGDPGAAQKQAQADLERAKKDLQQAEEELARELLVKIADQLEGLKKRQEALVDRSESLHAKVMKRKSWSEAFIDTLDGNDDAQKTIADETDSFKEKLKEAKVFHNILKRAKDSMEKASKSMQDRKTDLAVDRRYIDQGDGQQMDAKEIADEVEAQDNTIKHQKQAAKRLAILLDSIKQELAKKPKKKRDEEAAKNENADEPPPEQKGGMQAADGIPPTAQLKALRAEQLDLNERTDEFAKRHPDTANLNERQLGELRELRDEQDRLESLFGQLTAPPEAKEGGQP